ncbi:U2 snRNP-associated SURP domain-containing protein, partial [Modicella reniformis]
TSIVNNSASAGKVPLSGASGASGASSASGIESESTAYVRDAKAKRKKEMDTFLEELKRNQAERDERRAGVTAQDDFKDYKMGSRDTGDPNTTNLYIGNINPTVNEEQLCMEFAKYGPIASIKIMWPRTTEEIERNRNCGFVSFMERADAAVALKEMEGMELVGYAMKLGWGKSVPIPAVPFYVHKDYKAPLKPTKIPVRKSIPPSSTDIFVAKPTDLHTTVSIHRVIERVLINGHEFEQALIDKESRNPRFAFLIDHKSPEHIYYRWKLFSMMQGDTATRWRTGPFKMVDGGPTWVPPVMPFTDEVFEEDERLMEAHEDEFEKGPLKGTLSRGARGFLEAQLRTMTSQRRSIGRAMIFCMQHADAADEIVDVIVGSMMIHTTPQQARMARLYLISDILHNSSVPLPNVWKFRTAFEQKLPVVFETLNAIYRNIDARLKAEQFRRQIANVLAIWENWIVFPQTYIDNLADVLTRKEGTLQTKESPPSSNASATSGSAASAPHSSTNRSGFSNTFQTVGEIKGDEDIDGIPMEDTDLDGEPLKESEDLDGVPMDQDDLDGEPMEDEDLDGVPL